MIEEKAIELTEREQEIHFWKVAISRGDLDKAKEIYKKLCPRGRASATEEEPAKTEVTRNNLPVAELAEEVKS